MSSHTTIDLRRTGETGETAELVLVPPDGKPPTLDYEMLDALEAALTELAADAPRAAVVRSAAAKYFCVGANLEVVRGLDAGSIGRWVERGHDVLLALEALPCPTIAQVAGWAVGGGLELALACDVIFADPTARLGLTEAKLGLIPGWGGCQRLAERVGPARARRMFFAAEVLDAHAALQIGLIDAVADDPAASAAGYLEGVRACGPSAIAAYKRLQNQERADARRRNRAAEAEHSAACLADPDAQARLAAFFQRSK